ncbi:hypothetical protein C8Q78DRAFT_83355 [Trametes maxima]|nr:hypothetical protein C8Q78DRAFT_83355 [Trametes maxima]
MDLGPFVNPGETGWIHTANTVNPPAMGPESTSQIGRSAGPRAETSMGTRRHQQRPATAKQRKRVPDEHRVRGGAKPTTLHTLSSAHMEATSSRHRRHRQPPSSAGDRPLGPRAAAGKTRSAPGPPSSPAQDLLRRARRSAAAGVDAFGRRPTVMDVVLASLPAVSRYSEDVIMEAIELSRDALRPTAGVSSLEERSLAPAWDERPAAISRTARAAGKTPQLPVPYAGYEVSAERSTAVWPGEDPSLAGRSPPNPNPSPSFGTPQHM